MNTAANLFMALPFGSVIALLLRADAAGLVIILMLIAGSVYVWSLMLSKFLFLKSAWIESDRFLRFYRGLEHPAEFYLRKNRRAADSPLQAVYDQSCAALGAVFDVQGIDAPRVFAEGGLSRVPLSDRQISSIRNTAERTVAEQALLLESDMGYLASAASMAPFLGLLGTVMGVMSAFGSMAGSGTALLSEVAPGISSALLTTVVGLCVALPSSLGYNILSDRVRRLTVMMDNFGQELVGDLERVHVS